MRERPGDVARFTSIYQRHYPKVLGYALAHLERGEAEDVTHETFLTAWRKLEDIPGDDPLPWLLATARNHRFKRRDAGARQVRLAERIGSVTTDRDVAMWDTGDLVVERDAAFAAFGSLSEPDGELLILTSWYGLSPQQAAKVVGCSTAALFVRLHRARKRLATALEAEAEAEQSTDARQALIGSSILEGPRR